MASSHPLSFTQFGSALLVAVSVASGGQPDLPDLNVTHISRTPRYPAYVLAYQKLPGSGPEAMPQVADPQTGKVISKEQAAKIKRQPDAGEEVTFRGMVCNHGTKPTGKFKYTWYIDGIPVKSGTHDGLNGPSLVTDEFEEVTIGGKTFKIAKRVAGTYCYLEFKWKWQPGRHYIRLSVDPKEEIEEICEVNNSVMDATDASSFVIVVDAPCYNALATVENHWKSYNFEDIVKYHREQMHRKFKASVHPLTPRGVLEEIRYDTILVTAKGEPRDRIGSVKLAAGWDAHWDFTGYVAPRRSTGGKRQLGYRKSQDWGLPHELGHQLGLIDLYCLDTEGGDGGNLIKDENGDPILLSHFTGESCMMRGHGDRNFGEHSAMALNLQLNRRRGYFGDYLWSIPEKNTVRILDVEGQPVPNAKLTFYQHEGRFLPDKVQFKGTTNAKGEFVLPNRKCLEFSTDKGFTLRPNPFGQVNVVATNGVFFIAVQAKDRTDYLWMQIVDFNLAYWRGNTKAASYDLRTTLPGAHSLPPVEDFRQVTLDGGAIELRWKQRQPGETYTVYKRANGPPRWVVARQGQDLKKTVYRPGTGRYAVVASVNGKTSAFSREQRVVGLRNPCGITLDPEGRRILRDTKQAKPVMYAKDCRTIGLFGTFHSNISGGGNDIARMPDGRLIVTLWNKSRPPLFMLNKDGHFLRGKATCGSWGSGPMQFNKPTGVTVDSNGRVWVADTGNGRVQVLDSELKRMIVAAGADCGLKGPTKVAEISDGLFAIADPEAGKIVILSFNGTTCKVVSATDVARPVYVAASANLLFVSDEGKDGKGPGRVIEFSVKGGKLTETKTHGRSINMGIPGGLAYDAANKTLTVVDRSNRRLVNIPVP